MSIEHKKIKVGSRASRLAVLQVDEVRALLAKHGVDFDFDRKTYDTGGDRDKITSLTRNVNDDFFTDALDTALLEGEVDVTVHSAKDLPKKMREGLGIFALTESLDETDCFVGKVSFHALARNARVGTSSTIRQKSVKMAKPDATIVDIRGTIEERLQLIEKGVCDGIIVATAAMKRLGLERLIKDIMPWETVPLQGQLAIVGREDDFSLRSVFAPLDIRKRYGPVTLVGAGPGDPDLITVKGVHALREADCIFYDYLTSKELLHYAPQAEKIYAGKRKGAHTISQEELSRLIREKAVKGKNVVRLKGGDPLIFGRGAEEIGYLRSYHILVNVIPGVSSATAIPTSLGVPLTARDVSSSVAFISGHGKGEHGSQPRPVDIPDVDTIVFLMGLTKLDIILKSLDKAGWKSETPVLVVSRGTCRDEMVIEGNLKTITQKVEEQKPSQPALIIVGETVRFWDRRWHRKGSILYTGTNPEKFKPLGDIVHLPMIKLDPVPLEPSAVKDLISRLDEYHIVLLTSRASVKYFFEILQKQNYELSKLKEKDFVVIGKNTAEVLKQYHLEPALVPAVETSEGLLAAMLDRFEMKGKKVLFPRSSLPNHYLKDGLVRHGATVDQITVYQNSKLPKRELPREGIDKVLFTSPSTVHNFLRDYGSIPGQWKILSKGPYTSQSLKEAGYESEVLIYD